MCVFQSYLSLPKVVQAYASNRSAIQVIIRLLNMSALLTLPLLTVLTVFVLLNVFQLLFLNWLTWKQIGMISQFSRDNWTRKKIFYFFYLGLILGPYIWVLYPLPNVLTCHFACYLSFVYVCELIYSPTFISFLDILILLL